MTKIDDQSWTLYSGLSSEELATKSTLSNYDVVNSTLESGSGMAWFVGFQNHTKQQQLAWRPIGGWHFQQLGGLTQALRAWGECPVRGVGAKRLLDRLLSFPVSDQLPPETQDEFFAMLARIRTDIRSGCYDED